MRNLKLIVIIFLTIIIFGCIKNEGFSISGTIAYDSIPNQKVYLTYLVDIENYRYDTLAVADLVDGKFEFKRTYSQSTNGTVN